jgi:hypothetical protein
MAKKIKLGLKNGTASKSDTTSNKTVDYTAGKKLIQSNTTPRMLPATDVSTTTKSIKYQKEQNGKSRGGKYTSSTRSGSVLKTMTATKSADGSSTYSLNSSREKNRNGKTKEKTKGLFMMKEPGAKPKMQISKSGTGRKPTTRITTGKNAVRKLNRAATKY